MVFERKDFNGWCEQDVREEIIAPLLRKLGYEKGTLNDIYRGEHLQLKYPKEVLGRLKKNDRGLSGFPDYVLEVDRTKRWVIEAKPPYEPLTDENAWQAYSYAKHHEIRAVYFCLCNGRQLQIFRTDYLPSSALVKSFNYEEFENDFDTISNILSPDAIRKTWPEIQIDTGRPLGPNLRSFAQIIGGTFSYSFVSLHHPLFEELLFTITGGSIERTADGKLVALITTRSPLESAQRVAEQTGLNMMRLVSDDPAVSIDPSNPTIFSSTEDFSIPAGSTILDYTYSQRLSGTSRTIARGHLQEGVFRGTFNTVMYYQVGFNVELKGVFEAEVI